MIENNHNLDITQFGGDDTRPEIKAIRQLVRASKDAADALCDVLNAEYGAGNDEHEDVQRMASVLDELDDALKKMTSGQSPR